MHPRELRELLEALIVELEYERFQPYDIGHYLAITIAICNKIVADRESDGYEQRDAS